MRLKVYVVDLEIPRHVKKWALRIGIPAFVLSFAAVAFAAPLHTWSSGDTLQATDLNGNFASLQAQITVAIPGGTKVNMVGATVLPSGALGTNVGGVTLGGHVTGSYEIVFPIGTFKSAPICTVTNGDPAGARTFLVAGSSAIHVIITISDGQSLAGVDRQFNVVCLGN